MKHTFLLVVSLILNSQSYALNDNIYMSLQHLNNKIDGRLGVYALDTSTNRVISYNGDKIFPLQSTLKFIAVSAVLKIIDEEKYNFDDKIYYTDEDLVDWHPITGKYIKQGYLTIEELSQAAMSYSDNAAANLLVKYLGGLEVVNSFSKVIENNSFNVKHYEPNLNSNPNNKDDTSTPRDMVLSINKIMMGDILSAKSKAKLYQWMLDNKTGDNRIRGGLKKGWYAAEKTGSGEYGVTNDVGIIWSTNHKPIVLAIYIVQNNKDAMIREDIVASATKVIIKHFLV